MWYQISQILIIILCFYTPFIINWLRVEILSEPKVKIVYVNVNSEPEVKDNKIFNECLEVLISLGMKKADAKQKATTMFERKNYKTIEEFLMDAYKI